MSAQGSPSRRYLDEAAEVLAGLDADLLDRIAERLARLADSDGRAFVLGVGGSAANASHLVNDLRTFAGIEAYAPTDNVAELTARTNDTGWASTFADWLRVSRLRRGDVVVVLSVGGGDAERGVSPNLVAATELAREVGAEVIGVVGRDGGHTASVADLCVVIPTVSADRVTPHAESFQSVVWHLLVTHPAVARRRGTWEAIEG